MLLTGSATTPDVFRELYGCEMPESYVGWTGWRNGEIVVEVGVYFDETGQAWLGFERYGALSAFAIYRFAKRLLAVLNDIGVPSVLVNCDLKIRNSAKLLRRLDFERYKIICGEDVWKYVGH
jgi:hypothetical protein